MTILQLGFLVNPQNLLLKEQNQTQCVANVLQMQIHAWLKAIQQNDDQGKKEQQLGLLKKTWSMQCAYKSLIHSAFSTNSTCLRVLVSFPYLNSA